MARPSQWWPRYLSLLLDAGKKCPICPADSCSTTAMLRTSVACMQHCMVKLCASAAYLQHACWEALNTLTHLMYSLVFGSSYRSSGMVCSSLHAHNASTFQVRSAIGTPRVCVLSIDSSERHRGGSTSLTCAHRANKAEALQLLVTDPVLLSCSLQGVTPRSMKGGELEV